MTSRVEIHAVIHQVNEACDRPDGEAVLLRHALDLSLSDEERVMWNLSYLASALVDRPARALLDAPFDSLLAKDGIEEIGFSSGPAPPLPISAPRLSLSLDLLQSAFVCISLDRTFSRSPRPALRERLKASSARITDVYCYYTMPSAEGPYGVTIEWKNRALPMRVRPLGILPFGSDLHTLYFLRSTRDEFVNAVRFLWSRIYGAKLRRAAERKRRTQGG